MGQDYGQRDCASLILVKPYIYTMKKTLLFTDNLGAGGAQRQLVGLAVLLQQKGYDVKVCTYYGQDFYKDFLDKNNVPNELIPNAGNHKTRIWAVRRFFIKEQPDWVIAYLETPSLVACVAKLFGGKFRLIVSERNTTQHIGFSERIRFFLYHWADAIVPNSYAQGKLLTSRYPWMERKMKVISNFVDLEAFGFKKRIKRNIPEIAVVATIFKSKNTLGFIEAIKILRDNGLKFHVSWYGKSVANLDYFDECQQKIEEYQLGDYITLKDKTKQISQVYQECDFFCLPSFYEGTPNVICEAMSCGCPVLCSEVCDNPIYVEERENGFLFNPHSPQSIAHKIEQALNIKDEEYYLFCENSRKKAEQLLSKEIFVDKYLRIIEY